MRELPPKGVCVKAHLSSSKFFFFFFPGAPSPFLWFRWIASANLPPAPTPQWQVHPTWVACVMAERPQDQDRRAPVDTGHGTASILPPIPLKPPGRMLTAGTVPDGLGVKREDFHRAYHSRVPPCRRLPGKKEEEEKGKGKAAKVLSGFTSRLNRAPLFPPTSRRVSVLMGRLYESPSHLHGRRKEAGTPSGGNPQTC